MAGSLTLQARVMSRSAPIPLLPRADTKGPLPAAAPAADPGETKQPTSRQQSRAHPKRSPSLPETRVQKREKGTTSTADPPPQRRLNNPHQGNGRVLTSKKSRLFQRESRRRQKRHATLALFYPHQIPTIQTETQNALQRSRRHIRPSPIVHAPTPCMNPPR